MNLQVMEEFKWIRGLDDKAIDDYVRKTVMMIEKLYDNEKGVQEKVNGCLWYFVKCMEQLFTSVIYVRPNICTVNYLRT